MFISTRVVGNLALDSDGNMAFVYSPNATRPISVGMPLNGKQFDNQLCEAFFGGLLPEGDEARKALGRRFGISANSTFSLFAIDWR